MTKRQIISSFRKKLQEVDADTGFTNQQLYNSLMEQASWLIKRSINSGGIYSKNDLFQKLGCQEVVETSTIDECCPIKTNCKIYRTKSKIPSTWTDNNGPIIRAVTSVDDSTDFQITSPLSWQNKRNDPYQQMGKAKYTFYSDGYLWFPENNPRRVNISAYFKDDISLVEDNCLGCADPESCTRFLDTDFTVSDSLLSEMMAKALQLYTLAKQVPEDEQIDKNTNRRN